MKFEPKNDFVIAKIVDPPNKTAAGLTIAPDPKAAAAELVWMEAVAVAPNCEHLVDVGDKMIVLLGNCARNTILGVEYWYVRQINVVSKLTLEPGDELIQPRNLASEIIVGAA